jgi:hypothetical protein
MASSDDHAMTFTEYKYRMGKHAAPLANALRVRLNILPKDVDKVSKPKSEWDAAVSDLLANKKAKA